MRVTTQQIKQTLDRHDIKTIAALADVKMVAVSHLHAALVACSRDSHHVTEVIHTQKSIHSILTVCDCVCMCVTQY